MEISKISELSLEELLRGMAQKGKPIGKSTSGLSNLTDKINKSVKIDDAVKESGKEIGKSTKGIEINDTADISSNAMKKFLDEVKNQGATGKVSNENADQSKLIDKPKDNSNPNKTDDDCAKQSELVENKEPKDNPNPYKTGVGYAGELASIEKENKTPIVELQFNTFNGSVKSSLNLVTKQKAVLAYAKLK